MSLVIQNPVLINDSWLSENPGKQRPVLDGVISLADKASGASRLLGVLKNSAKISRHFSEQPSELVEDFISQTGAAISSMGVIRLASSTTRAAQAVSDLSAENGVGFTRKVVVAVRDVFDSFTSWVSAAKFIFRVSLLGKMCQMMNLTRDVTDLSLSYSDYSQAYEFEATATGEVRKALTHSKNYYLLRVAKAVLSVTAAVFSLLMLLTHTSVIPAIVMVSLSLLAGLLAIRRDLHKYEGVYQVIKFDRPIQLA